MDRSGRMIATEVDRGAVRFNQTATNLRGADYRRASSKTKRPDAMLRQRIPARSSGTSSFSVSRGIGSNRKIYYLVKRGAFRFAVITSRFDASLYLATSEKLIFSDLPRPITVSGNDGRADVRQEISGLIGQ